MKFGKYKKEIIQLIKILEMTVWQITLVSYIVIGQYIEFNFSSLFERYPLI